MDTGWRTYPIVVRVGATKNVIVALDLRVVLGIRKIIAEIFVVIVFGLALDVVIVVVLGP